MKNAVFLCISLFVFSAHSFAVSLPNLPSQDQGSSHKLFLSSQTQTGNEFDTWKIDSGYAYSLFDSVDIYVGARLDTSNEQYSENGFLSGVSYSFNERVSLKSTIHTKTEFLEDGSEESTVSAEVSSRVKISDNLDLHATLDYEQWQQGVEVGLGFRF
ncbi:ribonuclease regulator [Vibrio algarum]|uniref:Ribonuclease regulator n=1 Tax=Vibrio algarum TaxID=3020714 RepID=A0ABT4YV08_9VIBR|nr:ribonuclease regulator [Vibrio sp. KJ40-1]MDB1124843.1 ribonuclease regulator [Vibrio sp. KJ40-1]